MARPGGPRRFRLGLILAPLLVAAPAPEIAAGPGPAAGRAARSASARSRGNGCASGRGSAACRGCRPARSSPRFVFHGDGDGHRPAHPPNAMSEPPWSSSFDLAVGLVFGLGFVMSGMSRPRQRYWQQLLNLAKRCLRTSGWDPSLAFVMLGAIAVAAIGFRLVLRSRRQPFFAERFHLPGATRHRPPDHRRPGDLRHRLGPPSASAGAGLRRARHRRRRGVALRRRDAGRRGPPRAGSPASTVPSAHPPDHRTKPKKETCHDLGLPIAGSATLR